MSTSTSSAIPQPGQSAFSLKDFLSSFLLIEFVKGMVLTGSLPSTSTNMVFGQSYIEQLRDMAQTGGLLPKVIAAYNAGPAPLDRWNLNAAAGKDPLLYIESIP